MPPSGLEICSWKGQTFIGLTIPTKQGSKFGHSLQQTSPPANVLTAGDNFIAYSLLEKAKREQGLSQAVCSGIANHKAPHLHLGLNGLGGDVTHDVANQCVMLIFMASHIIFRNLNIYREFL
jgi:hypothetical protein